MIHVIFVAGFVVSKNDNQEHYVSGKQLARLYRIPLPAKNLTVKITTESDLPYIMLGLAKSKVLVLRPDSTEQYELTREQRNLIT